MKKLLSAAASIILCSTVFAAPGKGDYFTVLGVHPLYRKIDSEPFAKSLNHEGGLHLVCVGLGKNGLVGEKDGRWYEVVLTTGIWLDSAEWFPENERFWLFLSDGDFIED